jgi:hypothetical protein
MTSDFSKDEVSCISMTEESEESDPKAFERFRKLVKKVVGVPKSEVDRRAAEWRAARESDKNEESGE